MRIVLDANIFVSAFLSKKGTCNSILRTILINPEYFELILTQKMIEETLASLMKPRILKYTKSTAEKNQIWMDDVARLATIVADTPISASECRDPDDVIYLAAADISKSELIISADKDLLVLKSFKSTQIISPSDFNLIMPQLI